MQNSFIDHSRNMDFDHFLSFHGTQCYDSLAIYCHLQHSIEVVLLLQHSAHAEGYYLLEIDLASVASSQ